MKFRPTRVTVDLKKGDKFRYSWTKSERQLLLLSVKKNNKENYCICFVSCKFFAFRGAFNWNFYDSGAAGRAGQTDWIQLMKWAATCKEDFKSRSLILEYLWNFSIALMKRRVIIVEA